MDREPSPETAQGPSCGCQYCADCDPDPTEARDQMRFCSHFQAMTYVESGSKAHACPKKTASAAANPAPADKHQAADGDPCGSWSGQRVEDNAQQRNGHFFKKDVPTKGKMGGCWCDQTASGNAQQKNGHEFN